MALVYPLLLITNSVVLVTLLPSVPKFLIWLPLVGGVASVLGGIVLTERLLSEAAVVIVVKDGLSVQYQKSGRERAILFSSITECYSSSFKGTALLRITFRDGKEWFLRAHSQPGRFVAMANQVKVAHFRYVHGHSPPPANTWVPVFFKQPLATACLVGLAVILAGITWLTGIPDEVDSGSFLLLMGYVGFVIYAAIWVGGRRSNLAD